jgi:hypothetical protein
MEGLAKALVSGDPTVGPFCVAGPKFDQSSFAVVVGSRPSGDLPPEAVGLLWCAWDVVEPTVVAGSIMLSTLSATGACQPA